jgi:hypothetical protein
MAKKRAHREYAVESRANAAFWWRAPVGADRAHIDVVEFGRALMTLYRGAHSEERALQRIYDGRALRGSRTAITALEGAGIPAARLNATKAVVDTWVSRLSKDRPMPSFDVHDSNWELKRKSQSYKRFLHAKMLETEFDDLSRDALQDGGVGGTGITRIDDGDDDVFAERILRRELFFDPRETRYGKPRSAFLISRMARDYLAELYPDQKSAINAAPPSSRRIYEEGEDRHSLLLDLENYVDVYTAWHLPTSKDTDDGRHGCFIETGTLFFKQWHEPRFPWAMFRPQKPPEGVWGCGLVYGLADLQHRVNCIVRDMQMNLAATGRGFYAIQEAADMPTEMLTGHSPFKLKYKGNQPPVFTVPTAVNPAQVEMLKFFISQMFDLSGVSMAAATSKSALGAGASGVALDTQYDIDSDRFAMPQANYARYRLDAAQRYLDAAARVARRRADESGKKKSAVWVATWRNRDAIEKLEYSKVVLEEQQYRLALEPVNFIPDTRAGKLSIVGQLAQAGVIPQWLVATLFDEPDLAQANRIILAAFKNCMRKMDDLASIEIDAPMPEPYNDLELEQKIATAYYNAIQEEKAPPEIEERYRNYVDQVEDLIKKKKAGEAPPPGAMPVDPMAAASMPGAPPMLPPGAAMPLAA